MRNLGLQNESGHKIYLSIADGKLVRQHKNPIDGVTIERVNKKGNTVYEQFYTSVIAFIKGVTTRENDWGKFWEVELSTGDETMILSFQYSGRYANSFHRALPNVNLQEPVKIAAWSMKDKQDATKTVTGLSMYQSKDDGATYNKVEFYYTKDDPKGMPDMKKIKVKGKDTWDDSDMLAFFEEGVKKLNWGNTTEAKEPVPAHSDTEDAPF